MTPLSFGRLHVMRHTSLFKLNLLKRPGKTGKISPLTLLRKNSNVGEPFEGFHINLGLYVETSEGIS